MTRDDMISWLRQQSKGQKLFDRVIAQNIINELSQPPIDEKDICKKIQEWMKEGEHHYDLPNAAHTDKALPGTVRNYVQAIGWVQKDYRVTLKKAREEIKRLK